jgi:hypothetical protein
MPNGTTYELEARWFDKLNQSASGVRRLTDAYRRDIYGESAEATPFNPAKVRKMVEASADKHLADHINATK